MGRTRACVAFVFLSLALGCTGEARSAGAGGDPTDRPDADRPDAGEPVIPNDADCGNGTLDTGEACDDGNRVSGDGCSGVCSEERADGSIFDPTHPWNEHIEPFTVQDAFSDVIENGTFRVKCGVSHLNYDDPIVFPGEADRAHLHTYLGNMDADYRLTPGNAREASGSTCHGGPLNLSSYWYPTLLRPEYGSDGVATGQHVVVYPEDSYLLDENGVPLRGSDGQALENNNLGPDVYYKRGVVGEIQPMPEGLRMISGFGSSGPSSPQPVGVIRWSCHDENVAAGLEDNFFPHIPACEQGPGETYHVVLSIFFPMCWDGENLDVPDHHSHMAYGEFREDEIRCPRSHPVALPQVSYHLFFPILPETTGPSGNSSDWFLASDSYDVTANPGGYSAHGDWFMAWDKETIETFTRHCINEERHCANGDLGNGFRMSTLTPGRGNPEGVDVIHRGHGPSAE